MNRGRQTGISLQQTLQEWWAESLRQRGTATTIGKFLGELWSFLRDSTPEQRRPRVSFPGGAYRALPVQSASKSRIGVGDRSSRTVSAAASAAGVCALPQSLAGRCAAGESDAREDGRNASIFDVSVAVEERWEGLLRAVPRRRREA